MSKTSFNQISLFLLVMSGLIIIICPISASDDITDLKTKTSNIQFPRFLSEPEVYQQFLATQSLDRQRSQFSRFSRTEYEDLLQAALDNSAEEQGIMGISAVVKHPIGGTWIGTTGLSHGHVPIDPDMILGIGSNTKTFVAVLIFLLVEEGILDLDDTIGDYLLQYDYIEENISIRQLLQHTSGIYRVFFDPNPICSSDFLLSDLGYFWTPEEIITNCVGPPSFEPGASWEYSNTNYILLGMIIEQITESDLYLELRNRLWDPLDLERTYLPPFEELVEPMAHPWFHADNDGILDDFALPPFIPWTAFHSAIWASGSMFATAEDMAHWTEQLHSGNILTEDSYTEMYDFIPNSWGNEYGLGVQHWEILGQDIYGHSGNIWGYRSITGYDIDENITFAILTNTNTSDVQPRYILSDLLSVILDYEWTTLGDINQDGLLDILDIVQMVNCIMGIQIENCDLGDVNEDGIVNVLDVVTLVNMILDA